MRPLHLGMAVLALGVLSGCARHFNITTNSGRVITAKGKPRYDRDRAAFVFKDVQGVTRSIPAGSIRQIEPASGYSSPTAFNPDAN